VPYSSVVVIHPGSMYLRIGRVSDTFPHTVPHCIARHRTSPTVGQNYEDNWLLRPEHKVKLHFSQSLSPVIAMSSHFTALYRDHNVYHANSYVIPDPYCT